MIKQFLDKFNEIHIFSEKNDEISSTMWRLAPKMTIYALMPMQKKIDLLKACEISYLG